MPVHTAAVAETLVLSRDQIRVEIVRRPFAIDISRDGRRLIGGFGLWCADGEAADQFIQFTEGVIASERSEIPERGLGDPGRAIGRRRRAGRALRRRPTARRGRLRVTLPFDDTVQFALEVGGAPLRHAAGWDARAAERFAGLGARHAPRVDRGATASGSRATCTATAGGRRRLRRLPRPRDRARRARARLAV